MIEVSVGGSPSGQYDPDPNQSPQEKANTLQLKPTDSMKTSQDEPASSKAPQHKPIQEEDFTTVTSKKKKPHKKVMMPKKGGGVKVPNFKSGSGSSPSKDDELNLQSQKMIEADSRASKMMSKAAQKPVGQPQKKDSYSGFNFYRAVNRANPATPKPARVASTSGPKKIGQTVVSNSFAALETAGETVDDYFGEFHVLDVQASVRNNNLVKSSSCGPKNSPPWDLYPPEPIICTINKDPKTVPGTTGRVLPNWGALHSGGNNTGQGNGLQEPYDYGITDRQKKAMLSRLKKDKSIHISETEEWEGGGMGFLSGSMCFLGLDPDNVIEEDYSGYDSILCSFGCV